MLAHSGSVASFARRTTLTCGLLAELNCNPRKEGNGVANPNSRSDRSILAALSGLMLTQISRSLVALI